MNELSINQSNNGQECSLINQESRVFIFVRSALLLFRVHDNQGLEQAGEQLPALSRHWPVSDVVEQRGLGVSAEKVEDGGGLPTPRALPRRPPPTSTPWTGR
jgi:hypothetical protein